MNPADFLAEVKRRNVYKVAAAYGVVGWLVIQICSTVLPTFHAPEWVLQSVTVLVVLGFPIALVIAWAFELTPHGLKRTEAVDSSAQRPVKSHAWIYVVLIGAAISIALFLLGRYTATNPIRVTRTEINPSPSIPQKSIAVLPFENLSEDKSNAYFASGMQDMILTKLATIGDLKVISRTSTEKYKSKPDDLKVVGRQLGVANILEGSVQKAGEQVLINLQLIDAATDRHLWAEAYQRTLDNIFGVEGEVAQKVADALKATLLPAESARVASVPTKNSLALESYLKANYLFDGLQNSRVSDPVATGQEARDRFKNATEIDPEFALAYAQWSQLESYLHWYGVDNGSDVTETARKMAAKALALQPDLPEGHLAMGYYHYWGHRDYEAGLREFVIAQKAMPNSAEALVAVASVYRRQANWHECIEKMKEAMVLDPRDSRIPREIANTYVALRSYKEAAEFSAQASAVNPEDVEAAEQRALAEIFSGDLPAARKRVAAIPLDKDPQGSVSHLRYRLAMLQRQPDEALAAISRQEWLMTRWEHSVAPANLLRGEALLLKGETVAARTAFLEAERQLKEALQVPEKTADVYSYLGLVQARLGNKDAALEAAHAAVNRLPISRDPIVGAFYLERLTRVEVLIGATDSALKHIEQLMSSATGEVISIATLKRDSAWDPLRSDSRFQALLKKYSEK